MWGARLVLTEPAVLNDENAVLGLIKQHRINKMFVPTGLLHCISQSLADTSLEVVHTGGDRLNSLECLPAAKTFNQYGPTECTVMVTQNQLTDCDDTRIGGAIDNTQLYVLDEHLQLVPMGSPGYLYVGGVGLARGYWGREDLTRAAFIDNPFADDEGVYDRLYKTGDRVRWLADGTLEYLGRDDFQVMVRGFRVELGEIEQVLTGWPGLTAAVVVPNQDSLGQTYLTAFVVLSEPVDDWQTKLTQMLGERLPEYMQPAGLVQLDELPMTANGKIDNKALLALTEDMGQGVVVPARTDDEKALQAILAELLAIEADKLSIAADFFSMGVHSLLSIRLVSDIRQKLGVELPVKAIFDHPTIEALALAMRQDAVVAGVPLAALPRQSDIMPLSFAQQRVWFIDQLQDDTVEYNMPAAFRLSGHFDIEAAERAFATIIRKTRSAALCVC